MNLRRFSPKRKIKSFEASAKNTAGPAAETASFCGAKQNGKRPCPRFEYARERREIKIQLRGHAAALSQTSTLPTGTRIRQKPRRESYRVQPQTGFEPRRHDKKEELTSALASKTPGAKRNEDMRQARTRAAKECKPATVDSR